jgi:hypothetical protein
MKIISNFFGKIGTLILKMLRLMPAAPFTYSSATAWHFSGEWGFTSRGILVQV